MRRVSILAIILFSTVCSADDYYISSGQFIQTAIDSASYGDTVYVAAGTYIENITLKNGVALIGANPNTTVINGNQGGSVVTSPECDPNTLLFGFTLTNGQAGTGGGLFLEYDSSPTVSKCIFSENIATWGGGGIYRNPGCHPAISYCIFIGNVSDDGGAICNNGFSLDNGPYPHITNCLFIDNSASRGGAMYSVDNSNPTVTGCTFYGNTADSDGGGIYNDYFCDLMISNCIFWNNSTLSVSEIYNNQSTPEISNCDIAGCGSSGTSWDTSMGIDGGGNIDDDPLLVDPNGVDGIVGTKDDNLRLRSDSPCVDMGDSAVVVVESDFDGHVRILDGNCDGASIVDMGAYEYKPLQGDANDNCEVDMTDLHDLSELWLEINCSPCEGADLNLDGGVTLIDFSILAVDWLKDLN